MRERLGTLDVLADTFEVGWRTVARFVSFARAGEGSVAGIGSQTITPPSGHPLLSWNHTLEAE
jgi:hypothetical protein